jgi:hypothetical protein
MAVEFWLISSHVSQHSPCNGIFRVSLKFDHHVCLNPHLCHEVTVWCTFDLNLFCLLMEIMIELGLF